MLLTCKQCLTSAACYIKLPLKSTKNNASPYRGETEASRRTSQGDQFPFHAESANECPAQSLHIMTRELWKATRNTKLRESMLWWELQYFSNKRGRAPSSVPSRHRLGILISNVHSSPLSCVFAVLQHSERVPWAFSNHWKLYFHAYPMHQACQKHICFYFFFLYLIIYSRNDKVGSTRREPCTSCVHLIEWKVKTLHVHGRGCRTETRKAVTQARKMPTFQGKVSILFSRRKYFWHETNAKIGKASVRRFAWQSFSSDVLRWGLGRKILPRANFLNMCFPSYAVQNR